MAEVVFELPVQDHGYQEVRFPVLPRQHPVNKLRNTDGLLPYTEKKLICKDFGKLPVWMCLIYCES